MPPNFVGGLSIMLLCPLIGIANADSGA